MHIYCFCRTYGYFAHYRMLSVWIGDYSNELHGHGFFVRSANLIATVG